MSVELDGADESDLQKEELNCSDNTISECCVNEVSMLHMKHKYNCPADFAKDTICTETSEPVVASRVPANISTRTNNDGFPIEDSIHGKNVNRLNDGSVNCYENEEIANCVPLKAIDGHGNMVCEAEELPVCSICTDEAIDNSDSFRESQDSFDHSVPSNKVEYLGNMVDEGLSTDLLAKHNKMHISCDCRDDSENGAHGLCSQKVDQFNDWNGSHFGESGESTNDIYDCSPIKAIEHCGIVVDEEQAKELPICSVNSDPSIASSASFRDFHDLFDTSPTGNSVKSLDNMVDDVHGKEVPAYCNTRYFFSHAGGHLENGTYDLSSQQLNVCSSNGSISQITSDRLHETELVSAISENALNYYGSKIDCDSDEFARVIDTKVVRAAADDHSPRCPAPCLGSFCLLRLADDSTSEAEENILPSTFHSETDAAAERPACPPEILPKDDCPKTEFNLDQSIGGLEHTPEKLLSNRKTISPTSQEKLRQAVNGVDLYDALQSSKTRKRLWYENSAGNEIPSSLSGSNGTKPLSSSDRMTKKPKGRNDDLPIAVKGILKSPDASNRSPCSCMESSLAKKQTQKAIEFSQQQMHDIEGVAMKLLKGLKSMKSIVQRNMLSEDSLPMTSNLATDEIRAALDNASTLEGYTKRWLTIMARDCNRFCKIMKGDKKEASVNGIRKEGKKISFADEAGGLLCHVKVLE
ncbi:hypothetical protein IHE45_13G035300 [Dioscorea alata]|uniref:Uncharacterized protein n=1 Tax=Dioscorea alata TaxID=55571 RepID=A0ACB7UX75_DIOAL|nr:hypothetical protein IHE45_13G035300 [Dioscorea alata]